MLHPANVWTILRRELSSYFNSPIAYVFIVIFLLISGAYLLEIRDFFDTNRAELRPLFEGLPYAFLVLVPAISMRIWSEEKKMKTFHLLMTLPLKPSEIILGKFLAAWAVLGLALLMTLPIPLGIEMMTDLEWGPVIGGYLGAFVMVGAFLAVGLFVSGVTDNQIISFVLSLLILFPLIAIGHPRPLVGIQDDYPLIAHTFGQVGVLGHFESVARGVIDSSDLVYFLSLVLFFLGLNRYTIESHRFG